MTPLLMVASGGALGAMLRYGAVKLAVRIAGGNFPWGVILVNVLGSFAMGLAFVWLMQKAGGTRTSLFLMTGVLGGFTTFSAFSLDTLTLIEKGRMASAAGYVSMSVVLSLAAVFIGVWMMRLVMQ